MCARVKTRGRRTNQSAPGINCTFLAREEALIPNVRSSSRETHETLECQFCRKELPPFLSAPFSPIFAQPGLVTDLEAL